MRTEADQARAAELTQASGEAAQHRIDEHKRLEAETEDRRATAVREARAGRLTIRLRSGQADRSLPRNRLPFDRTRSAISRPSLSSEPRTCARNYRYPAVGSVASSNSQRSVSAQC